MWDAGGGVWVCVRRTRLGARACGTCARTRACARIFRALKLGKARVSEVTDLARPREARIRARGVPARARTDPCDTTHTHPRGSWNVPTPRPHEGFFTYSWVLACDVSLHILTGRGHVRGYAPRHAHAWECCHGHMGATRRPVHPPTRRHGPTVAARVAPEPPRRPATGRGRPGGLVVPPDCPRRLEALLPAARETAGPYATGGP